jgi:hypothetical protein
MFGGARQKVIILGRSYNYQTQAYYCALLAEARGHRVLPNVETMLDLRGRAHYEHAIPDLEEAFNRDLKTLAGEPPKSLFVAFGRAERAGFERFAQLLFEWFRAPALTITLKGDAWRFIQKIEMTPLARCSSDQKTFFADVLKTYTGRKWRAPKPRSALPPFASRSARPQRADAAELAGNADALGEDLRAARRGGGADHTQGPAADWRSSTPCSFARPPPIRNHTYQFARRAVNGAHAGYRRSDLDDPVHQQGIPLGAADACGLPVPDTLVIQIRQTSSGQPTRWAFRW